MAARRTDSKKARSKADREFVSEAEELVERMRSDLSDLHDLHHAGREVDPDLLNNTFRSAHSLKGLVGMFGLDGLGDLAHHMEDILDGLRLGRVTFDSASIGLLDEAVALFARLLEGTGVAESGQATTESIRELVTRIEASVESETASVDELESLDLDPALLRALTEYEEHRLRESIQRGRHLALVDTTFEIIAFEEGLAEISAAVREVGEVISTLPSPGEAPESQIRFSLLVATDVPVAQLAARIEFPSTRVEVVAHGRSTVPIAERLPDSPEASADSMTSRPSEASELESLKSISDTVRVDIRKLDELMNLVGELVIQRNAIARIAERLGEEPGTARFGADLSRTHRLLDRKLKELQAGVLDVRMVPLRQVFEKLSRVVRRLRRDLDKDVQFEFRGAETELDKLIVEQLVDPLMHIVRNAFDHAIEEDHERVEVGKPAHGTITVEAFQRGNHVVLAVRDDGRGIDPERVRRVAVERGLISQESVLSAKETLDLVFGAGFSTRAEVGDTSGRGVGMDVVRENLTSLGGIVELQSELGHGTTVTMTLPITLAIIQALIVRVGEQRFAIPLNSVLETLLVSAESVQTSEGRELLNLRGEPLLLRRLADEFSLVSSNEEKPYVVVLGLGELRLGLLVDALDGQRDTVIKSIRGPVAQVRGIAGATELGEEGAILVLDVSSIVEDAVRRKEAA